MEKALHEANWDFRVYGKAVISSKNVRNVTIMETVIGTATTHTEVLECRGWWRKWW